MNLFEHRFNMVLEADAAPAPVGDPQAAAPQSDKEAMAQTLTNAKPEDFDIQGRETVQDHRKSEQITKLKEWIGQIDQFIKFLNGTEPTSVQVQLHAAPCDSIFEDIARSEKKKISRLAAELSSLSESLKGYLISANDR
jgi:hypothetical protein